MNPLFDLNVFLFQEGMVEGAVNELFLCLIFLCLKISQKNF